MVFPKPTRKPMYKTSDGSTFPTPEEAAAWECFLASDANATT